MQKHTAEAVKDTQALIFSLSKIVALVPQHESIVYAINIVEQCFGYGKFQDFDFL